MDGFKNTFMKHTEERRMGDALSWLLGPKFVEYVFSHLQKEYRFCTLPVVLLILHPVFRI